jgi:hypothetical protein
LLARASAGQDGCDDGDHNNPAPVHGGSHQ